MRYCNEDFFTPPIYNVVFRTFYIVSTAITVLLMLTKFRRTYDRKHDTFSVLLMLTVCIPFTLLSTETYATDEIAWTYSLWLESIVILPQLFMLRRTQRVDVLTTDYIFLMGSYRLFYLLNFVRKAIVKHKTVKVIWVTGIVQTLVYIDFLYYYVKAFLSGTEFELPR
jgi:ER lumen protein retaining receptor